MTEMHTTKDEDIVRLLQKGDHRAFEEIYRRYKLSLIRHAYKKLGLYEDAKEIVQDVFTSIWVNHANTPKLQSVSGWLYILVRNKALKHIEHQQVMNRYEVSFSDFAQQGHHFADIQLREKEMKALIDREIENLAPKMRQVLLLSRTEHLSNKAIADKLNISENTVKNHLKAAIKLLRKRLGIILTVLP